MVNVGLAVCKLHLPVVNVGLTVYKLHLPVVNVGLTVYKLRLPVDNVGVTVYKLRLPVVNVVLTVYKLHLPVVNLVYIQLTSGELCILFVVLKPETISDLEIVELLCYNACERRANHPPWDRGLWHGGREQVNVIHLPEKET